MTAEQPAAYSVASFMTAFGIGRTKLWSEIREGKLRAVKCGSRVLILRADAEAWQASLPDARS